MLQNEYLDAKIGVDTAETEPSKDLPCRAVPCRAVPCMPDCPHRERKTDPVLRVQGKGSYTQEPDEEKRKEKQNEKIENDWRLTYLFLKA